MVTIGKIINNITIIIIIRIIKYVMNMGNTTISVTKETKEALLHLGTKGETYDSIIKKLIKRFAWKKLDDEWNKILANDEFIPLDEL